MIEQDQKSAMTGVLMSEQGHEQATTIPHAVKWKVPLLAVLGMAAVVAGLCVIYFSGAPAFSVEELRITIRPGLTVQGIKRLLTFGDTPDLYAEVWTKDKKITTNTRPNVEVGSGLSLKLPEKVDLAAIKEIKIWDDNLISDTLLDRTDQTGLKCNGAIFDIECVGTSNGSNVGQWLCYGGGGLLLLAAIQFVRRQVI